MVSPWLVKTETGRPKQQYGLRASLRATWVP